MGNGDRSRESEGRRRQDDDLRQSCRLAGSDAAPRAARSISIRRRMRRWARGVDKNALEFTICDVLLDDVPIARGAANAAEGGFTILPSNQELTAAEVELCSGRIASFGCATRSSRVLERLRLRAHRLPAGAQHADGQRADGDGSRADPDAVRVLRARGTDARCSSTIEKIRAAANPKLRSTASCARCSTRGTTSRTKFGAADRATSAIASTAPSSRATCAWPRRRASASPCCSTTSTRAARWPISRSRAR